MYIQIFEWAKISCLELIFFLSNKLKTKDHAHKLLSVASIS